MRSSTAPFAAERASSSWRRAVTAPVFLEKATAKVQAMGVVMGDFLRRRMATQLVDAERKLRLEAAGYETELDEVRRSHGYATQRALHGALDAQRKATMAARELLAKMHTRQSDSHSSITMASTRFG